MKRLETLNNEQLAKELFRFVPEGVPDFLRFMQTVYQELHTHREECATNWSIGGFIEFDTWFEIATRVNDMLTANERLLAHNGPKFSEQLFEGYNAFWTRHCLELYAKSETVSINFKNAVHFLFVRERKSLCDLVYRLEELNRDADERLATLTARYAVYAEGRFDIYIPMPEGDAEPEGLAAVHPEIEMIRVEKGCLFVKERYAVGLYVLSGYRGLCSEGKLEVIALLEDNKPTPKVG